MASAGVHCSLLRAKLLPGAGTRSFCFLLKAAITESDLLRGIFNNMCEDHIIRIRVYDYVTYNIIYIII